MLLVLATLGPAASASAETVSPLRTAVRDLDTAAAALTADRGALPASLHELAPTLRQTNTTLRRLDRALPEVRQLAHELLPGVRKGAATVEAARAWTTAAGRLTADGALEDWGREMRATVPQLTRLATAGHRGAPRVDALALCLTKVLLPAGKVRVEDGRFTTGQEVYKSLASGLPGLGSVIGSGTAPRLRVQPGLGSQLLDFGPLGDAGTLLAAAARTPIGVRPVRPAQPPPLRADRACTDQPVPDPNRASGVQGDAAARVSRQRSVAAREGSAATDEAAGGGLTAGSGDLVSALVQRLNPLRTRPPATTGKRR